MDYKVDMMGLIQQLKDTVYKDLVLSFAPDDSTRETLQKTFEIANRHGVSTETVCKIIVEVGTELSKNEEKENERK